MTTRNGIAAMILLGAVASPVLAQRGNNKFDVAAPTNITFSLTSSALTINWPAASGALHYDAVRRNGTAVEQLGSSPTNAFVLPVPAQGVAYEYQITAVGKLGSASSSWVAYTVPVPTTVTAVLVQPTATGMTTPAGPDQLTAVSNAPGTISLWWSEVPYATHYQVFRSFTGGETDRLITTTGSDANGNVMHQTTDGPVDVRYTYSYKIAALVKPGTTEIQTGFSPVASAQSLPLAPVSGLTYTLTPSTKTLGRLDARITWNTMQGAIKYMVYDPTWAAAKEFWPSSPQPATMSYVQPGLPVGYTLTVCVSVIYPFDRGGSPVPCVDVKT
jgi:hypothetical protein